MSCSAPLLPPPRGPPGCPRAAPSLGARGDGVAVTATFGWLVGPRGGPLAPAAALAVRRGWCRCGLCCTRRHFPRVWPFAHGDSVPVTRTTAVVFRVAAAVCPWSVVLARASFVGLFPRLQFVSSSTVLAASLLWLNVMWLAAPPCARWCPDVQRACAHQGASLGSSFPALARRTANHRERRPGPAQVRAHRTVFFCCRRALLLLLVSRASRVRACSLPSRGALLS